MKASVAISTLAVVVGLATSAYAHTAEKVRRELESQGYDQIEFKRKKVPFWVDACHGTERFHLHVDYYGKITKKTVTGPCPGRESPEAAATSPEAATPALAIENENSSIATTGQETDKSVEAKASGTAVAPKAEPKAAKSTECKRYFPATGTTLTVTCE